MFSWNHSRTRCTNRHNNIFSYKVRRKYLPQLKRLVVNDLDQIANDLLAREQSIGTIPASNGHEQFNGASRIMNPKSDFWLGNACFSRLACHIHPGGDSSVKVIGYNRRNQAVFRVWFGYPRLNRGGLQSETNDAYLGVQDPSIASREWTGTSWGQGGDWFSQSQSSGSRPFSHSLMSGGTNSHKASEWWPRLHRSFRPSQASFGSYNPSHTRLDGDHRTLSVGHY